jgi:hypothetical protein
LRGWGTFEICPSCNRRLDLATASDIAEHDPEAAAPDLLALVGEIAVAPEPFPAGAVNRYISTLLDEAWQDERELELWRKLPRDDCIRYANAAEPISLTVARRIAYWLEVPIAELLRGEPASSRSFNFAASCPLPRSMRSAHRQGLINGPALAKQIALFLDDSADPASLREVARQLGVSVGAMRYHAPAQVLKLAERYDRHQRAVRAEKQSAVLQAVKEGVRRWFATRDYPIARKPLLRLLRKETQLPKEMLRKAIQSVLRDQVA